MTKKDLIEEIALKTGTTVSLASAFVDAYNDTMVDFIKKGQSVYLRGFATFKIVNTKPKKARNIGKGETILLPERKRVKFIKSKSWEIE